MARSLGSRVVLGLAVIAWAAPAIGQPTEVPVVGAAPAGPVSTDVRTQLATSYNTRACSGRSTGRPGASPVPRAAG